MHNDSLSLCVVGAGGSYTPEIIEGVLDRGPAELPISEIRLTDADPERLSVMTGLAKRMAEARGRNLSIWSDTDLSKAAAGSAFVVTQIRVGGMKARHVDETIPLKYGVIGQETTGPGGMFKALRTIPVMLEIAREVADAAPDATILNYTNPSGIVTEAVLNHTNAKCMGLCSGIPGAQAMLSTRLEPRFGPVKTYSVGLNHLGFIHRIESNGEDITREAIDWLSSQEEQPPGWRKWLRLARAMGAVPMPSYSNYYFYRRAAVTAMQGAGQTRAEQVMDIEAKVLAEAADPHVAEKPPALAARGGDGYSQVTFDVLGSVLRNEGREVVMSTLNRGAVDGIPDNAAVEVTCRIDADGAHPLRVGEMPIAFRGLVQAVKAHETMTIEAAVTRSRTKALQALIAHPLVGDLDAAEPMLDDLLAAHGLDYS